MIDNMTDMTDSSKSAAAGRKGRRWLRLAAAGPPGAGRQDQWPTHHHLHAGFWAQCLHHITTLRWFMEDNVGVIDGLVVHGPLTVGVFLSFLLSLVLVRIEQPQCSHDTQKAARRVRVFISNAPSGSQRGWRGTGVAGGLCTSAHT